MVVMFKSLQKRHTAVERIVMLKIYLQKRYTSVERVVMFKSLQKRYIPLLRGLLCSKDVFKKDIHHC